MPLDFKMAAQNVERKLETDMASRFVVPAYRAVSEDILAHLPVSVTREYKKGEIIYGPDQHPSYIYLVAEGYVKLSQIADHGSEILLDIVVPDELFGESAFVDGPCRGEQASALGQVRLMIWPITAMEEIMTKRPGLAVALLQIAARRSVDFAGRIESFSFDNIERRLARALIRFSERMGTQRENGSVVMMPLTHSLLGRHIGTSRELTSHYMNQFRKYGYLTYSRQEIVLQRSALAEWTRSTAGHRRTAKLP